MKTPIIGIKTSHPRPWPHATRLRAEFPVVTAPRHDAQHDFLVPNPRPDLTPAVATSVTHARFVEADSIFWRPPSWDDDAA